MMTARFSRFCKQICGAKSPKGNLCYPLVMPKIEAAGGNPFSSSSAMGGSVPVPTPCQ